MPGIALALAWLVIASFVLGMLGAATKSSDTGLYKALNLAIGLAAVVIAFVVIL